MEKSKTAALVVAGCAAACAGVSIVPGLMAGAAGFGALGLAGGLDLALVGLVGAGVAYAVWRRMRPRASGCTGTACQLDERR